MVTTDWIDYGDYLVDRLCCALGGSIMVNMKWITMGAH